MAPRPLRSEPPAAPGRPSRALRLRRRVGAGPAAAPARSSAAAPREKENGHVRPLPAFRQAARVANGPRRRGRGFRRRPLATAPTASAADTPGEPLVLHVSPAGDDRWSGWLPEPNAGSPTGPSRRRSGRATCCGSAGGRGPSRRGRGTPPRRAVPALRAAGLHARGLRADPLDGPAGETPVLSGAVPVAGWRVESRHGMPVWTTDVSALVRAHGPFRSLFVNGERRPRPRLPKEGYWRIESVPGRALGGDHWKTLFDGSDAFVAAPGTVQPWRNLADVEAVVLHFWIEERLPLTSFDPRHAPRPHRPQDAHGPRGRGGRRLPALLGRERLRGARSRASGTSIARRDGSTTRRGPASGRRRRRSRCPCCRPCCGSRASRRRSVSWRACASRASPSSTPPSLRPSPPCRPRGRHRARWSCGAPGTWRSRTAGSPGSAATRSRSARAAATCASSATRSRTSARAA